MVEQAHDSFITRVARSVSALRWQDVFVIEASGVRTVAAVAAPLVAGQIAGNAATGLLIGMGGLQIAFADMPGAKLRHLIYALLASMAFVFLGALVSNVSVALAVGAMLLVAFLLSMLSAYGNVVGNIGFVTTISYAFAQNTPVPLSTGLRYVTGFALGGLWAIALTLMLWHLRKRLEKRDDAATETEPLPESIAPPENARGQMPWQAALRKSLRLRSPVFQHAIRTAVATAITVAISRIYHPPHAFWLVLSVLIILKPDYAATQRRVVERVLGSIIGGLLAMLPVALTHNIVVLDILLVVMGIIAFSHLPRNYGLYVLFLTPFIVFLTTVAAPHDNAVALARIYETIIGGAIAFAVAFLLRSPRHWVGRDKPVISASAG